MDTKIFESPSVAWATVDEQGRLIIPSQIAEQYGLKPGSQMRIETGKNDLRLHRPISHLTKIYVEPTNRCNITCRTCMRNIWDTQLGMMSDEIFETLINSLKNFEKLPTLHFSGIGEPLFHRKTPDFIAKANQIGCRTELITNGTLLTKNKGKELIDAGLDMLWISLDGATPESYADVRLGAELPGVIEKMRYFRKLRPGGHHPRPEIGVAFVAMKRNIHELGQVIKLGRSFGAKHFMVSNVLPYTDELQEEMLYEKSLRNITYLPSPWMPTLSLPKMDLVGNAREAFLDALTSGLNVNLAGNNLGGGNDVCIFIESGSLAVGWNGEVAPCPPLLHNHSHFLKGKPRHSYRHIVGMIQERDLQDIWNDPEYVAYRRRVQSFAFAPSTYCGGCELTDDNLTDCFWNPFPACGGCLWAQAVIQCP